jgi:hypothetical protein
VLVDATVDVVVGVLIEVDVKVVFAIKVGVGEASHCLINNSPKGSPNQLIKPKNAKIMGQTTAKNAIF